MKNERGFTIVEVGVLVLAGSIIVLSGWVIFHFVCKFW
jgi:Flp pilus assembly pilin Flp